MHLGAPARVLGAGVGREGAEVEVLFHGHRREEPPALGHDRDAALDDAMRGQAVK